jgi:DNA-binding transcriptional ArsR family regulator
MNWCLISPDSVFDASLVPETCLDRFVDMKGLTQQVSGESLFRTWARPGKPSSRKSSVDIGRLPGTKATARHADRNHFLAPPLYALTRIFHVEYIKEMESVFEIIAEPNRRAILTLLVSSQQSVGELERQLRMPQPTVSKHLRVLRDAGFVESTVDAQRRLYRLKPEPFQEVDAWLAQFRQFWSAHVDALERHLDRMDQATKMKTRKRTTRPRSRA